MPNVIPTKGSLMAVKRSLALAELGYDLMDRKRNILIREMMALIESAGELQSRIAGTFERAYASLQMANITLGITNDLADSVSLDDSVAIKIRSVMGVELPIVGGNSDPPPMEYGFAFSNSALDSASAEFHKVKLLSLQLAEVETAIYRLAHAIKKTQKRANALQNIIIPGFCKDIKFIADALEEKEREAFVALKVLKKNRPREEKNAEN